MKWLFFATLLPFCITCSDAVPGPQCDQDCISCVDNLCPQGTCGIMLSLGQDCQGSQTMVEVAVNQCIEPEELMFGNDMLLCHRLSLYQTVVIHALGDSMVWQRELTCTPSRERKISKITLYCGEEEDL